MSLLGSPILKMVNAKRKAKDPKGRARMVTKKELDFVENYLETGDRVESVIKAYPVKDRFTASAMASQIMAREHIQDLISGMAGDSVLRIEELARTAKNESVKLSANKDLLDRAGFKPTEWSGDVSKRALNIYSNEQIKRAAQEILRAGGGYIEGTTTDGGADGEERPGSVLDTDES